MIEFFIALWLCWLGFKIDFDINLLNLQPSKKINFLDYKNQDVLRNYTDFREIENLEIPEFKGLSSSELVESWRTWKKSND